VQLDCSASELLALNALLKDPFFNVVPEGADPQIQGFGLSWRESPGVLVQMEPSGRAFWAGPPCGAAQPCNDVPPIFESLLRQLEAIDAIALPDPACAAYAPGADAGPPVTGL
jgi:hypothetical protein